MHASPPASLTGSDCGAPKTHTTSVSVALGRLRTWVSWCCWLLGLVLLVQATVWMLTAFTELRYEDVTYSGGAPMIVTDEGQAVPEIRSALDEPVQKSTVEEPVNPNRMLTKYDRLLGTLAAISGGIAALAVLIITPLVTMGVLLAAASATSGVERTISAFGWSLVIGLLILSFGGVIGLPWQDGALWSYTHLTSAVEAHINSVGPITPTDSLGLTVLSRYLLLPVACLIGVAMVGAQFRSGVKAGLLRKENLSLDPTLEQEAHGVVPGSLHGGPGLHALERVVSTPGAPIPAAARAPDPPARPATTPLLPAEPDPEMPKRLI